MLKSQNDYFKHVSKHLREISLAALPLPVEDEEDSSTTVSESTTDDHITNNQETQVRGTPGIDDHNPGVKDSDLAGVVPSQSSPVGKRAPVDSSNEGDVEIQQHVKTYYTWFCVSQTKCSSSLG